ncbi:unnamed protein product [Acanthosepion pharaonis]|uniref:Uncharacterized protein n=1 Tax=Acanthosepion pharaonis TaxID=158019 RepID=A0A812DES5_ACAPH|nr:unnamed protein product [Sepia pharaonis]
MQRAAHTFLLSPSSTFPAGVIIMPPNARIASIPKLTQSRHHNRPGTPRQSSESRLFHVTLRSALTIDREHPVSTSAEHRLPSTYTLTTGNAAYTDREGARVATAPCPRTHFPSNPVLHGLTLCSDSSVVVLGSVCCSLLRLSLSLPLSLPLSHSLSLSLSLPLAFLFFPLASSEGLLCLFPGVTLSFLIGDGAGGFVLAKGIAVLFFGEKERALAEAFGCFFNLDGEDGAEDEGRVESVGDDGGDDFGAGEAGVEEDDFDADDDDNVGVVKDSFNFIISWILSNDGSLTVHGTVIEVSPVRLRGVGVSMDAQALGEVVDIVWSLPLFLLTTCQSPSFSLVRGEDSNTESDGFPLLVLTVG